LSWRWHPAAIEAGTDYAAEPTTLVVFELQEVPGGTLFSVTESGFDQVPPARRLKAFRMNSNGWEQQMKSIEKHVATP
jgi:Activator of Hsp90 ATPase homolog 1-like protein